MLIVQKRLADTLPLLLKSRMMGGYLFIDSYNKRCENEYVGTLLADKQDCGRSHYYILHIKNENNMEYNRSQQIINIENFLKLNGVTDIPRDANQLSNLLSNYGIEDFVCNDPESFSVEELAVMDKRRKEINDELSKENISEERKNVLIAERKIYPIVRIRKLIPRETYRLMDVEEDDIDKMLVKVEKTRKGEKIQEQLVANSSHYKCAGNSIVVSCLYHIFRTMFVEKENGDRAKSCSSQPIQLTLFDL